MTDAQLVAVLTAIGGLGGVIRWAVGAMTASSRLVADQMFETRVLISALDKRDKNRDANQRRKRESEQPRFRGQLSSVPVEVQVETTDVFTLMEEQREELMKQDELRAAKSRGERKPRAGTHHDEDR